MSAETVRRARPLLALLPFALAATTGIAGVDFGYHWDESFHLDRTQHSIDESTPLPGVYVYPSVCHLLTLAAIAPEWIAIGRSEPDRARYLARMHGFLRSTRYQLRLRAIFVLVSALGSLWIFLLVLAWRDRAGEAALAAGLYASCWELVNHSRFVAPDAVVAQFAALHLLGATLAMVRPNPAWWLRLGAIGAALATGTKYPAGLLLLPVVLAAVLTWPRSAGRGRLVRTLAELGLLFVAGYLVTTPGTLLEATRSIHDVRAQMELYRTGWYGYTITPGAVHLGRMLRYLAFVLSPARPVAALFALCALLGSWALFRESRRLALVMLSFPVVYLLYFSTQRVMVVRNLLVLLPVLVVLSARGAVAVAERLGQLPRFGRATAIAAAVALCSAMVGNGAYLVYAVGTIRDRRTDRLLHEVDRYLAAHPERRYFVSPSLAAQLVRIGAGAHPNTTTDAGASTDAALFFAFDALPQNAWPANQPGLVDHVFGALDIDFDYNPSWRGSDRVLLMPVERARRLGVVFFQPRP